MEAPYNKKGSKSGRVEPGHHCQGKGQEGVRKVAIMARDGSNHRGSYDAEVSVPPCSVPRPNCRQFTRYGPWSKRPLSQAQGTSRGERWLVGDGLVCHPREM